MTNHPKRGVVREVAVLMLGMHLFFKTGVAMVYKFGLQIECGECQPKHHTILPKLGLVT